MSAYSISRLDGQLTEGSNYRPTLIIRNSYPFCYAHPKFRSKALKPICNVIRTHFHTHLEFYHFLYSNLGRPKPIHISLCTHLLITSVLFHQFNGKEDRAINNSFSFFHISIPWIQLYKYGCGCGCFLIISLDDDEDKESKCWTFWRLHWLINLICILMEMCLALVSGNWMRNSCRFVFQMKIVYPWLEEIDWKVVNKRRGKD